MNFPIKLNGETVNTVKVRVVFSPLLPLYSPYFFKALWTLPKGSINEEQHKEFYQFIAKVLMEFFFLWWLNIWPIFVVSGVWWTTLFIPLFDRFPDPNSISFLCPRTGVFFSSLLCFFLSRSTTSIAHWKIWNGKNGTRFDFFFKKSFWFFLIMFP